MYILKSVQKEDFLMPHLTYSKKKSFHLIEGTMKLYENLKGQKWKKPLNILKNDFLETDLQFKFNSIEFLAIILRVLRLEVSVWIS